MSFLVCCRRDDLNKYSWKIARGSNRGASASLDFFIPQEFFSICQNDSEQRGRKRRRGSRYRHACRFTYVLRQNFTRNFSFCLSYGKSIFHGKILILQFISLQWAICLTYLLPNFACGLIMTFSVTGLPFYQSEDSSRKIDGSTRAWIPQLDEDQGSWFGMSYKG